MAAQVLDGGRRPRGHLLAQSLAVHAGLDDCLTCSVCCAFSVSLYTRRSGGAVSVVVCWMPRRNGAESAKDLLGARSASKPHCSASEGIRVCPGASRCESIPPVQRIRCSCCVASASVAAHLRRLAGDRFSQALPWSLGPVCRP